MGEQIHHLNLQPIAPAGTIFYLLDLNGITQGATETIPLHLIFNEAEQRPGQHVLPLLPSKPKDTNSTGSPNRGIVINSTSGQEITKVTKPETKVNIFSNENVTPHLQSAPLVPTIPIESLKKQTQLKEDTIERCESKQKIIKNKEETNKIQNYIHIPDRVLPPRALAVLPTVLQIRRDNIFPVRALPPRVRFGPVQGVLHRIFTVVADELVCEASVAENPIFFIRRDENFVTYIDVSDKEKSNWLSLLPLGKQSTANVWLYEEDNELYGITTKLIPSRTPLALGYSKKYAEEHSLTSGQPVLDLEEKQTKWWCFECRRSLGSATLLLRHMNMNHKDDSRLSRRKYRCTYCSRTFSRLFTLKRHTSKICTKRPVKSVPSAPENDSKSQELDFGIAQNTEDNRTPSDESFQNYTSALDFSTNLFDPDRISNLDMSGSSKSETEFNPYSNGQKFETLDNNEDYSKFCKGLKFGNDVKKKAKLEETATLSCPRCDQTMTKTKKRRHLRDCPARRLECECGKVYTRKDDFAKHIHLKHNTGLPNIQNKGETEETDAKELAYSYKCDECHTKFKRRGMLVNHLWRVHNTTAAEVPLERRIRHYPCSVCPKIYRTAAKRDRHVRVHHPGARIRAAPIEGERRRYQPAKCSECPREYVTRSKLLQHIRAQHPELALSTKAESKPPMEPTSKSELPPRQEPTLAFY